MKLEKEIIWNRVTKTQKDEYYIYVDIIHSVFGKQYIICITTEIRYRLRDERGMDLPRKGEENRYLWVDERDRRMKGSN